MELFLFYRVPVVQKQRTCCSFCCFCCFPLPSFKLSLIKSELTVVTTVSYVGSNRPVWSKPSAPEHNHTIVTENGALLGRPSHVSQLPRTGGEPLSLTKALLVNRACRIHLFVLEDEKPAGVEFCFDICFERRWGKGKILDPVRGRLTCKLLSEGNFFGQSVRKETEETGQERHGQKEKFGFYCHNNKGIAAWEHLTFAVKYFWVVVFFKKK